MNKPEYECAELLNRCLNDGITVVLLKSNADIGSPAHLILLELVPEKLPDTTGAPKVLLCINPYGLLPSFLYCVSNARETPAERMAYNCVFHDEIYSKHQHHDLFLF